MKKIIYKTLLIVGVMVIASILIVGTVGHFRHEALLERSSPIWSTSSSLPNKISHHKEMVHIAKMNGDIVLQRDDKKNHVVLFRNYSKRYSEINFYLKDLDKNHQDELIAHASSSLHSDSTGSEIHVFYNLKEETIKSNVIHDDLWFPGKLYFTDNNEMYIQTCGSQYCTDTYLEWNGKELIVIGDDYYKSM